MVASSSSSGFAFTLDTGSPPLFDSTVVCVWLFLTRREGVPGGSLFPCSLPKLPMFACSHAFSLFDPLLIHLLTTYHRPQFPPAKPLKKRKKDSKSKTYKTRE